MILAGTIRKYTYPEPTNELGEEEVNIMETRLKTITIKHPAIKSFEIIGTEYKEEGLSNLTNNISAFFKREYLNLDATAIKVVTLAGQEYIFPIQ